MSNRKIFTFVLIYAQKEIRLKLYKITNDNCIYMMLFTGKNVYDMKI